MGPGATLRAGSEDGSAGRLAVHERPPADGADLSSSKEPSQRRLIEAGGECLGIMVRSWKQPAAAAVAGEEHHARRLRLELLAVEKELQVFASRLGISNMQLHRLANANLVVDDQSANTLVGLHDVADEEIAAAESGLVFVDDDAEEDTLGQELALRFGKLAGDFLTDLDRRPTAEFEDHVVANLGHHDVGANRSAALAHEDIDGDIAAVDGCAHRALHLRPAIGEEHVLSGLARARSKAADDGRLGGEFRGVDGRQDRRHRCCEWVGKEERCAAVACQFHPLGNEFGRRHGGCAVGRFEPEGLHGCSGQAQTNCGHPGLALEFDGAAQHGIRRGGDE